MRIVLQSLSTEDYDGDEIAVFDPNRAVWRIWLPWGLAAVLAALAIAAIIWPLRTPSTGGVTKVLMGVEPAGWLGSAKDGGWKRQTWRLSRTAMALSPDGRHLVYSAGDDTGSRLYVRGMDETQATPIPGTEGGVGPFFSPDGEWVGFWADGFLEKVRTDGSPPVPVCDAPSPPFGASWGADDVIVFGQYEGGVLRVSAGGGAPEEITKLAEGEFSHRHPQFVDDGETLLFTARIGEFGDWGETKIVARRMKTGERKILVENGSDPRFAPTGHLVFVRQGVLMAVPFDPKRLAVTGGLAVVLESVRQGVNAASGWANTFSGQFDFCRSGTMVYVPGGVWRDEQNSLVWVDREGREEPLSLPISHIEYPRLSPDGTRVVVQMRSAGNWDVWVYDISRGTFTRSTLGDTQDGTPIWTPDGARITFSSERFGLDTIYWIPADGSGNAERLSTLDRAVPVSWSPDGQVLAFRYGAETSDIWLLPLEGEPQPFIESPFEEGWPAFSPDGRWLAYGSNQSGRWEVYVTSYPGRGPRVQISTDGGVAPTWAPNGRELFFRKHQDVEGTSSMWAVDVRTEPDFSAAKPRELFKGSGYLLRPGYRSYDVTLDGQKFLMTKRRPRSEEAVTHLNVTFNWFEELKRLVPTD